MIQDIALIAFALAHGTDDELDAREVEEIAAQLQGWRRDPADPTALAAMKVALERYVHAEGEGLLDAAIARVGTTLPADERAALLVDLTSIALADDKVTDAERRMLDRLSDAWGVAQPIVPSGEAR